MKKSEMLQFYSKVFDTIEIDATLYGIPASTTFEKWYDETPDGFKFGLKTPREVTHDGRLSSATIPVMLEFVERSQLLKEKLGVFLIQLPPSFDGSRENGQNLREFLDGAAARISSTQSNFETRTGSSTGRLRSSRKMP